MTERLRERRAKDLRKITFFSRRIAVLFGKNIDQSSNDDAMLGFNFQSQLMTHSDRPLRGRPRWRSKQKKRSDFHELRGWALKKRLWPESQKRCVELHCYHCSVLAWKDCWNLIKCHSLVWIWSRYPFVQVLWQNHTWNRVITEHKFQCVSFSWPERRGQVDTVFLKMKIMRGLRVKT